jgi:hypothetical protein
VQLGDAVRSLRLVLRTEKTSAESSSSTVAGVLMAPVADGCAAAAVRASSSSSGMAADRTPIMLVVLVQ